MGVDPVWLETDFYATLGVAPDASKADITRAYRRLARELHPDANRDPSAEGRFKEISAAYEVLGDARKRAAYDQARQLSGSGARRRPGGGYSIRVDHLDRRDDIDDGQTIRVPGKGRHGSGGVEPHEVFGRDGRNLTLTLPVSYAEAALGADVAVPTLDGHPVTLRIPPGTPSGRVLRVRGRGVPLSDGPGDLLVTVHVEIPTTLDDRQRELIRELGRYDDPGRRAHLDTGR